MKFFLARVRQAGASGSRATVVIILVGFAILTALLGARTPALKNSSVQADKPAIANSSTSCTASTVFSASFTQGQAATPEVVQQWKDFIQSLTPAGYDTVTISGTFDSTGRTLTDGTVVPQIATAMQNGSIGHWNAGGFTWNVGIGCGPDPGAVELNANAAGDTSTCTCSGSPAYVVRPDIGPANSNWGGANTVACNGPSQTITVNFSGPGPATTACAKPPAGMVSWWAAEGDANDIQDGNGEKDRYHRRA